MLDRSILCLSFFRLDIIILGGSITFPVYPFTSLTESVDAWIFSSDQFYQVLNEDENTSIAAQNGPIPSVRKIQKQMIQNYATFVNKGAWVTATSYVVNDLVQESGNWYVCLISHTSGTFATDLTAGRWQLFQILSNNIQRFREPRILATASQTVVNLSTYTYTVGVGNITVYVNDEHKVSDGIDYTETNSTTITFTAPLTLNDTIDIYINDNTTSFVSDAANVTYSGGTNVENALDHPKLPLHTDAELNDSTDAVNTTNKVQGSVVFNTTIEKPVYAAGSGATDVWKDATATLTNTPIP